MNDSATVDQRYQHLRAFVRPSIFALLGLSLLLLIFRENVIDVVGTWWYDTVLAGIVACILIIGIISFFKGFKDENLYKQSTDNNESIQQQKTRLKQLSHDEVQERFRSKVKTNSRPSDPINIPVIQQPSEEETYQLRNQLLKKTDILGELNIALKHLRTITANQTEKIQQLQSELSIKDEYIQHKDSEIESVKEELKMSKQQVERLQNLLLIKDEIIQQKKSLEDFEKVSKEAQKLQKQVSAKDIMNYEKEEKIKELKNAYFKLEQKLRQNNTLLLPKKRQTSIQPRSLQQTPIHSVVICKNVQQVEQLDGVNGNNETVNLPRKQSSPSDVYREKCQSRTLQQTPVHSVVVLCKNVQQVQQQNDINDKENLNLPRKQSSPSKAVCENCQQEVQQNDDDKELGLPRKRYDAVSNVELKISSSPKRPPAPCDVVVVEPDDDDFPSAPKPALLNPTFPPPQFSSSTPCLSVKETPSLKISPNPEITVSPTNSQRSPSALNFDTPKKSVTRTSSLSFIYPITPTYPRSIIYHNKSYIEPSSNNTPKRTPQGRR